MYILGVDTGGTFTDTVVTDEEGNRIVSKSATTPDAPEEGVLDSLEKAAGKVDVTLEELLSETEAFYHGTTLVTNAIVEQTGCDVGIITTQGFTDEIHIGQTKTRTAGLSRREIQHYAALDKPDPMVPKPLIKGVEERVDYKGEQVVPLDDDDARDAIGELLERDVDAISVSLLWSFVNPTHEQRIGELIREMSDESVYVSLSSDIAPRLGEYSRGASTLINSYTGPILSSYSDSLSARLREHGLEAPIYLMQSNGGVVPLADERDYAVKAIDSGPAGGIAGGQFLGGHLDQENIICTDVGGTSFDVGMIVDGEPKTVTQQIINKHTLHQTAVDIESIGSGGGSIAWVDDSGQIHVGPESAGADPGPACYGEGGERPTVTDADLVLGYLDPDYFLDGDKALSVEEARAAMREHVAGPLGVSVEEAAAGVFRIVNSHMADLLHKMTIERGYDPRRFSLFAYGGAGPVHASFYGAELGVDSLAVPLSEVSSVYSAFGIASSDIMHVEEVTDTVTEPFDADEINETLSTLAADAQRRITSERDANPTDIEFDYTADMRYADQVNELEVRLPDRDLSPEETSTLGDRFEDVYERRYGAEATYGGSEIEIVTFRVTARLPTPDPVVAEASERREQSPLVWKTREVFWGSDDGWLDTDTYRGRDLTVGARASGPALLQMPQTTISVRPDQIAIVDRYENVQIKDQ